MTGDVTIEPNASCLVMTTEIWCSIQYKGSETLREVAWISFDEVHYMGDRERDVVWKEGIVMVPKSSRFVFLSATVRNDKELADWVAKNILNNAGFLATNSEKYFVKDIVAALENVVGATP